MPLWTSMADINNARTLGETLVRQHSINRRDGFFLLRFMLSGPKSIGMIYLLDLC